MVTSNRIQELQELGLRESDPGGIIASPLLHFMQFAPAPTGASFSLKCDPGHRTEANFSQGFIKTVRYSLHGA
jgi:hypothetical protein